MTAENAHIAESLMLQKAAFTSCPLNFILSENAPTISIVACTHAGSIILTHILLSHSHTVFVLDRIILIDPATTQTSPFHALAIKSGTFCPMPAIYSKMGANFFLRLSQFL